MKRPRYFRASANIPESVAIANAAGAEPWFTPPWNADPDYVARFADYVASNLDPSLSVYVELWNESWNRAENGGWTVEVSSKLLGDSDTRPQDGDAKQGSTRE